MYVCTTYSSKNERWKETERLILYGGPVFSLPRLRTVGRESQEKGGVINESHLGRWHCTLRGIPPPPPPLPPLPLGRRWSLVRWGHGGWVDGEGSSEEKETTGRKKRRRREVRLHPNVVWCVSTPIPRYSYFHPR